MCVFRGIKITGTIKLITTAQISFEMVIEVMWLRTDC